MNVEKFISPKNFGEVFLYGNHEEIYNQCVKEFKELVSLDQFIDLAITFNQEVESYQMIKKTEIGYSTQYLWLDNNKERIVSVTFDTANYIQGIVLKPYVTFPKSDQRYTKNKYIMPIKEEWFVFWGGTNEFLNYHYVYESQRYAYDLVKMKNGQTHKDNRLLNESYYAFDKEVVAPADGKVVKVINDIVDNIPGEMNEKEPAGNYVILEHENREYSLLAHFKQHSIVVKEGDAVKQGQTIGLCGNSGNSSEPHIHFQVMDSSDYVNCHSIRISFYDGVEPIQGDTVTTYKPNEKSKMDVFDKVENTFTLADFFLFIPRIIGTFFK